MLHGSPPITTPLIGRDAEVDSLLERVSHTRLVTLTGLGGVGKTRLALEAAARWTATGKAAKVIDLSGVTDAGGAASALLLALGAKETSTRDTVPAIAAALGNEEVLLVIDNLEQVRGADLLLRGLLDAAGTAIVLGTSRVPLGLPAEHEFLVGPLELPRDESPASVESSPAGQLFLTRARTIGALSVLGVPEAVAVAQLCRRLDGLPLALELAAARTRILSPQAIERMIEEHRPVLRTRSPATERHASLESVIDWTVELLSPEQRFLLEAATVCAGSFDLHLAQALAPHVDVLEELDGLVAHGLVQLHEEIDREPRFRLLETVRAQVARHIEPARLAALQQRHAERIRDSTALLTAQMRRRHETMVLRRLDADADNIDAALRWATEADPDTALAIAASAADYWLLRGQLRAPLDRIAHLLQSNPRPSRERAGALAGLVAIGAQLNGPSRELAFELAELGRSTGDQYREIQGLTYYVFGSLTSGHPPDLRAELQRIRTLQEVVDDPAVTRLAVMAQGIAAVGRRERSAMGFFERSAALARQMGNHVSEAMDLGNLAAARLEFSDPTGALEAARRAVDLLRTYEPGWYLSWSLGLAAVAAAEAGDLRQAEAALGEAIDIALSQDSSEQVAQALRSGMALALARSDGLMVARLWGSSRAMVAAGQSRLQRADERAARTQLARARRQTGAVEQELAIREGSAINGRTMLAELRGWLKRHDDKRLRDRPHQRHGELTAREVDILEGVGRGLSDVRIAEELGISPKTVSVHVANAKGKLGVRTRLEAALRAREMGLVGDGTAAEGSKRSR